jgi:hypothetical protein
MTAAPFIPETLARTQRPRPSAVIVPLHRFYTFAQIDRAVEIAHLHAALIVAAGLRREEWHAILGVTPAVDPDDDITTLVIWTLEHEQLTRELELPGPPPAPSLSARPRPRRR